MSIAVINRKKIIADIEACCKRLSISRTEFGQRACKDPALFGRLKDGRDLTLTRIEKVYAFINNDGAQSAGGVDDLLE